MAIVQQPLSSTFMTFFQSEKIGGAILILCTIPSLLVANSRMGQAYSPCGAPMSAE